MARMGGEEFSLVLPGTDIVEATAIADELCTLLAASPMKVHGREVIMTSSFGVATIADSDTSISDMIVRADRALYR